MRESFYILYNGSTDLIHDTSAKIVVFMHVCSCHMKLTIMANFTCRYFRDQSATNICKCLLQLKTLESASGKATVLSSRRSRHIIRCLLYCLFCNNGNVYDFTYMYRYIHVATCIHHVYTCIRAWLLHALSKQSCKAIVTYSDSICTIDVTPWGLASLACVRSVTYADFHCARAVRRLLKVTKVRQVTVKTLRATEAESDICAFTITFAFMFT